MYLHRSLRRGMGLQGPRGCTGAHSQIVDVAVVASKATARMHRALPSQGLHRRHAPSALAFVPLRHAAFPSLWPLR